MSHGRRRLILALATVAACWLGMQWVHEAGHVLGAWLSGGRVERVVLHPLRISRTDLAENAHPLHVVWAGSAFGVIAPLAIWWLAVNCGWSLAFMLRFFAGFCLVANGLYLAVGSIEQVGDCRDLLRHGAPLWQLWLFGAVAVPAGFRLWHGQGASFGWGPEPRPIVKEALIVTITTATLLILVGLLVGGE